MKCWVVLVIFKLNAYAFSDADVGLPNSGGNRSVEECL